MLFDVVKSILTRCCHSQRTEKIETIEKRVYNIQLRRPPTAALWQTVSLAIARFGVVRTTPLQCSPPLESRTRFTITGPMTGCIVLLFYVLRVYT